MQDESRILKRAKQNRDLIFYLLCLLQIVLGVLANFIPENNSNAFELVSTILTIILLYSWCHFDARLFGFSISHLKYLIILLAIIGIPIYFWQTRTMRQFFLNIGGLWILLLPIILNYIAAYFTYFALLGSL